MEALFQFLFRTRYYLLALTVILLGLSIKPLLHTLKPDNSLEIWFKDDAPALEAYRSFNAHFGSDEMMIIIATAPSGWLESEAIMGLQTTSDALSAIPEVKHVHSAADTKYLEFTGLGIASQPLLEGSTAEIRARLGRMPDLESLLFNDDYTTTRVLVQFRGDLPMDSIRGSLIEKVKSTAGQNWPEDQLAFGGVGVIFSGLNALTEIQFGRFVFLAYLLMLILLSFLFRSWRVSFLALSTMSLATIFSLALYGLGGHRLNLMTVLVPMVVLLLSTMDVIHLLYAWFRVGGEGQSRLKAAMKEVWKPCLFTTLTTMSGFLALLFSPMKILQQFGLYSAIGIGLSLVFTWILAVLILPGFSPKNAPRNLGTSVRNLKAIHFDKLSLSANPGARTILIMGLIIIFFTGIFQLESDTYTLGYLPDSHEVAVDHTYISQHWGPYMPLELMIRTEDENSLTRGAALSESLKLHRLLQREGYEDLFGFTSLYLARGRAYGHNDDSTTVAAANTIRRQVSRHYPKLWDAYLTENGSIGRITLFGEMQTAGELDAQLTSLMEKINSEIGEELKVEPAGYMPLYAELVPYVTASQVRSLFLAALFIAAFMWLYFKDLRLALIALITNAFPLLGMFGLMGWLAIPIDIATASIGAIGLSFCVDDSIHFTAAWQVQRKKGKSLREALKGAYDRTGKAIVFSSLVLLVGFAVMMLSPLKTVYLFGGLTCVMIALALFAQLVVFPWMVQVFEKKA